MKVPNLVWFIGIERGACAPFAKVAVGLAFAIASMGCAAATSQPARAVGSGETKTAPAEVARAPIPSTSAEAHTALPAEARDLVLSFVGADGDAASAAISRDVRAALVRDGYWLAAPGSRAPDGRLELSVTTDAEKGTSLAVSLVLVRGDATLEALVTSLDPGDAAVRAARIDDLLQRLNGSPRLATFAAEASSGRAERRSATPHAPGPEPRVDAGPDQAAREQAAWSEAALRHCRNARGADACKKLREYVDAFPDGPHASVARAALELSARRGGPTTARVAEK